MSALTVACSPLTNTIYTGSLKEDKKGNLVWCNNRQVVTKQAVDAVVERLSRMPKMMEEYTWQINGKRYTLNLVEYTPEEKEAEE